MRQKLIGRWCSTQVMMLLGLITVTGLGLSAAGAQTSSQPQTIRPPNGSAAATSGSGQYYFEFRSRQAWDYGHTFVVFGRVGEAPSKKNVSGLSPKGDHPQMWLGSLGFVRDIPGEHSPDDTSILVGEPRPRRSHAALALLSGAPAHAQCPDSEGRLADRDLVIGFGQP